MSYFFLYIVAINSNAIVGRILGLVLVGGIVGLAAYIYRRSMQIEAASGHGAAVPYVLLIGVAPVASCCVLIGLLSGLLGF